MFFCGPSTSRSDVAGKESVVIDAVVDDMQAALWDAKKGFDVEGGAVAYGDDFLLGTGERFHYDATIEHPCEVIFSLHVEWGEIVNRADRGAGCAVDETAVTRNMQDIEFQFGGELGQSELMPEDVFDRWRGGARHGNEAASVFSEVEKR